MNHVDPELLAAWTDDTLSSDESRAVESHLADCAQCRAVAAAFSSTMEPESRAEGRMSLAARGAIDVQPHSREGHAALRAARLKWILPLAATIVIGASITWKYWTRPEAQIEMAATAPAQPIAPPQAVAPPQQTQPNNYVNARPLPPSTAPAVPPAKSPKSNVVRPTKPAERATAPVGVVGLPSAPPPVQFTQPAQAIAAPPPPPPVLLPPPPPSPPPAGPPPVIVQATSPPPAQILVDTMSRATVSVQGAQSGRGNGVGVGMGGGRGGAAAAARPASISSTPPIRWRITPPNEVARSIDDGATWTPVAFDGTGVQLVAGAAPNASVCWLIGRAGAVFLSKNGDAFKRLPFPEAVDLASLLALDDLRATVITADGRSFVTEDGGQTWRIARF